jgi:hypothetical protein
VEESKGTPGVKKERKAKKFPSKATNILKGGPIDTSSDGCEEQAEFKAEVSNFKGSITRA